MRADSRAYPLVGLSGYARSGKDAVAAALVAQLGFTRAAFADSLKDCLYRLNPRIVRYDGRKSTVTEVVDALGWDLAKTAEPEIRCLLQRLGADAIVPVFGKEVLVDAALGRDPATGPVVVSDVRFEDEMTAVKSRGGIVVRIVRPGCGPTNGHHSETAVDAATFDACINNDGSLDDLASRAVETVRRFSGQTEAPRIC
jgi:hypothetical protein